MTIRKKGKILKIKPGYNPNCSSGMWALGYIIYGFMAGGATAVLSIISAIIIFRRHLKASETKYSFEEISEEHESEI